MRKTIAAAAATGALLFSGAGVAHATTVAGTPAPSSTTTTLAEDNQANDNNSDKTGLWGLLGLLGLGGLAGLKRRNDRNDALRSPGTTRETGTGNIRA
jgi:MYXO-CTERM domain-containing protein